MKYFHGFSLENEEKLFSPYLLNSDYCVAGFSFGAQQALEYTYESTKRIDRLILLSPAFFQTQKQSFIRTQLRYFKAGEKAYVEQFISNVSTPSDIDLSSYLKVGLKEELESLLTYVWEKEKIKEIQDRGTTIEVFLGSEDKIIDAKATYDFFVPLATTYLLKNTGHLLK
ncbi:MAG: pimelyl-ACP methyl ester esterase BioV [Sulfurovum sp.]|nr:pimelyl-ACP methyl ester esterase BioV [Sulfurovum sp.]